MPDDVKPEEEVVDMDEQSKSDEVLDEADIDEDDEDEDLEPDEPESK